MDPERNSPPIGPSDRASAGAISYGMDNQPSTSRPVLPSPVDLVKQSFKSYKARWKLYIGILIIPIAIQILSLFFDLEIGGSVLLLSTVGSLALFFGQLASLHAVFNEGVSISEAYRGGFKRLWSFIWITILSVITILGGLYLLVIPGMALSIWLGLSTYVLFNEDTKGAAALVRSWHYTKGSWWALFGRFIVAGIVIFVGGLIFGLIGGLIGGVLGVDLAYVDQGSLYMGDPFGGQPEKSALSTIVESIYSLFAIPFSLIFGAYIYRSLQAQKPLLGDEETIKLRVNIRRFMIVGIVGTILLVTLFILFIDRINFP